MNIKLVIAYDGTDFLGWQKTDAGKSIEETLQKAIQTILQEKVCLQAASRTDAGVHARGQVVNFVSGKKELNLSKFHYSLNSLLPKTVSVLKVEEEKDHFHPTLDSKAKVYHYELCLGNIQLPHHRLYSWHIPYTIDLGLMKQSAEIFIGEKDFSAFCNVKKNEPYKDKVRFLKRIAFVNMPRERLRIEIEGAQFLYKMVRNIVGTIVYVGLKKIRVEDLPEILMSGDRTQAGVTAPAHGLTLFEVVY